MSVVDFIFFYWYISNEEKTEKYQTIQIFIIWLVMVKAAVPNFLRITTRLTRRWLFRDTVILNLKQQQQQQ